MRRALMVSALFCGACSLFDRSGGRPELAPDPERVRYRHALELADVADELEPSIAALEARVREAPSPFDTAELAELYYRRAQREGDRLDYLKSEIAANRSLAQLPKPNAARLTLAKLANARHEFRRAIALAGGQPGAGAQIVIATARLALGEPLLAVDAADAAIAIRASTGGYLTRALAYQAMGRDVEAARDFSLAASLEEYGDKRGAARLRALWGRFLLRRGEYVGAESLFDEALRISPGFAPAIAGLGELALRNDEPARAVELFEEAFVASRQVRYLIDQERAEEAAGDRAGADELRALAEKLVRAALEEDGLGHALELVELLIDRGGERRLLEAEALAREELTRRASFEVRFQLARALVGLGERDRARAEVEAALATGAREEQLLELAARLDPSGSAWRTSREP